MYKEYYQLSAEPFRLTPDPRFVYAHRSYRKAQAYMKHTLEQGDGILVITGRSGTGKTTLVEDFLAGLKPGNVLTAKLVSTQLEVDDLLRMLAYAFGLDAKGLDKATLLRDLEKFLIHQPRALLIIDEAQNLSTAALEEVRMLTNLHTKSRPLLQIFLLGQENLQQWLHTPEMEQLHQRLTAACDLEPLSLQETRDYVLHRLACAGWRGDPTLSNTAFVLIHRFSQGLPRYISKLCARLFLHGAVEHRHRLGLDDLVTVIQEIQGELLLPLMPKKESNADEPLPGMQELIESKSLPSDWMVYLTAAERAFIKHNPAVTAAVPPSRVTPLPDAASTAAAARRAPAADSAPAVQPATHRAAVGKKAPVAQTGDIHGHHVQSRRRRRRFSRGKILAYGVAAPIVLMGVYIMGAHNAKQQQAPIRADSFAARVGRTAIETSSPDTPETKPLAINSIEAVGLLPRTRRQSGVRETATERTQEAAAPALADAEDAAAAAENVAAPQVTPTPAHDAEQATASAEQTGDPLAIATLATNDYPVQTLLTSTEQTTTDSNRAKTAGPLLGFAPAKDPVMVSGYAVDLGRTVASAPLAGVADGYQSLAAIPVQVAQPQPPNSEQDTARSDEVGAAAAASVTAAPNEPATQPEHELQQAVAADQPPLETLPTTDVESETVADAGDVSDADISVVAVSLAVPPGASGEVSFDLAADAADKARDEKIGNLLLLGEKALAKNRLRFPEEGNAWHYYKQVLALDPGNQAAGHGLQKIAGRYAGLASGVMKKQQYAKAQTFINRGLGVVPGDEALLTLQREIEERQAELLTIQERERMLALQAREARALAAAARRTPKAEPKPSGFFGTLKAIFADSEETPPDQLFQAYDR